MICCEKSSRIFCFHAARFASCTPQPQPMFLLIISLSLHLIVYLLFYVGSDFSIEISFLPLFHRLFHSLAARNLPPALVCSIKSTPKQRRR